MIIVCSKTISILIFLLFLHPSEESQKCLRKNKPYKLFGTKTLYRDVGGRLPATPPRGCSPVRVYLLSRHGARYPGSDTVEEQEDLYQLARHLNRTGKAKLCKKDLQRLRNWDVWMTKYEDKNLTTYGKAELKTLALRYQRFLKKILGVQNSPSKYRFTCTSKQRVIDSMNAFIKGLFHNSAKAISQAQTEITPKRSDPLESDNCPKYDRVVANNPNLEKEFNKFVKGPFISQIARKISRRLGIPKGTVNNQMVLTLYRGCYDEHWVKARNTAWCQIFSNRDLKILEYSSDVEDYPSKGYKFPVTYKRNCFLSKEIVNFVKSGTSKANVEDNVLGKFRFASSGNILTLAENMRLYEEHPGPTADDIFQQMNRTFRTSYFIPSAANIAFILYRCDASPNQLRRHKAYKVQTYWNEKLLKSYPACPSATENNKGLCDLDTWLSSYRDFVFGSPTECNQKEICT